MMAMKPSVAHVEAQVCYTMMMMSSSLVAYVGNLASMAFTTVVYGFRYGYGTDVRLTSFNMLARRSVAYPLAAIGLLLTVIASGLIRIAAWLVHMEDI